MALKVLETLRSKHVIAILSSVFIVWGPGALAQQGGPGGGPKPRPVDCASSSLQDAIEGADSGDSVLFEGTCNEDITITKDRIRLSGDPDELGTRGGSGTINGSITVLGADNIILEFLTVTGAGDGIAVIYGGHAQITGAVLDQNQWSGLSVANASAVEVIGTSVTNNGFGGLVLNRNGVAELRCNNSLTGNTGAALWAEEGSIARQQECATGEEDIITAGAGEDSILSFNESSIDVRGATISGPVVVYGTATFRLQQSSLAGNVDAEANSLVGFRSNVTFNGTLNCDSTSGIFGSRFGLAAVQCGQACTGAVGTCTP